MPFEVEAARDTASAPDWNEAMSAKVHMHLSVSDLEKSRQFYVDFCGAAPVKEKTGYVKFLPEWAPVNLALSAGR